jgi:hypothetical protein
MWRRIGGGCRVANYIFALPLISLLIEGAALFLVESIMLHAGKPLDGISLNCGSSTSTLPALSLRHPKPNTRINCDTSPLPPPPPSGPDSPEEDEDLLKDWPWIDGPIKMDYGYNVR